MEEVSVAQLIYNYNLVVPEIQREYVWGLNTHDILDTFIHDIKEGYKSYKENQNESSKELEILDKLYADADELTKKAILKMKLELSVAKANTINIGFIYSYRPDYYVFNDRNEDVYLIDGQQRFTTLFLILFYLSVKENRKDEFEKMFRFNKNLEHIAFDYRVRTLTHNFFIDLISNTHSLQDLEEIRSKNWFLSDYKSDTTVRSIVGNAQEHRNGTLPILNYHFKNETDTYFDYVKSQIKFWHFKTEETSQGEELYITMNSRGQQLADNENIRAKLFEEPRIKENQLEWSEKWEN
jgi:hypothetical protein